MHARMFVVTQYDFTVADSCLVAHSALDEARRAVREVVNVLRLALRHTAGINYIDISLSTNREYAAIGETENFGWSACNASHRFFDRVKTGFPMPV